MSARFHGKRTLLAVGVGLLTLLAGPLVGRADEKPGSKTTGPWNLEALRQAPKVTLLEEGRPLTSLHYEGESYQGRSRTSGVTTRSPT